MTREPLLRLREAVVVRDGSTLLSVDRLDVWEGEHLAIVGPNGAGKSTLVGLLSRDVRPLAHEDRTPAVLLRGRELWDLTDVRTQIGIVSDTWQDAFDRPVTVRDAVTSGVFGSVGLFRHQPVTPAMRAKVDDLMAFLQIAELADRTMETLSTGEARRALIGRALVNDPPLLVLDEPCDGLDPKAARQFLGLVRTIAASGRTIVLVTHHIDDIVPEISRVVALRDGRVVRDGAKEEALTSEALGELYDMPARVEGRDGWYRMW